MKRLKFTDDALQEIHDYIATDNPHTAYEFIECLQEQCNQLTSFPGIGRKRDEIRIGYRSIAEGDYIFFIEC